VGEFDETTVVASADSNGRRPGWVFRHHRCRRRLDSARAQAGM